MQHEQNRGLARSISSAQSRAYNRTPPVYLRKPARTKTDLQQQLRVSIMSGNGKVIEERLSLQSAAGALIETGNIFYSRFKDAMKNSTLCELDLRCWRSFLHPSTVNMLGLQPLPTNAAAFYYSSTTKHKIRTSRNQHIPVPDLRIISRFYMSVSAYKRSGHFPN